jgi:Putative adhesin
MRLARTLATLALLFAPAIVRAQVTREERDADWLEHCRGEGRGDNDSRGRACEVRAVPVKRSGRSIAIDGERNGGIRVFGWSGDSVRVTARIQAQAPTDGAAQAMLPRIHVIADGRSVRSEGPDTEREDDTGWSVSYVVYVPRRFDLDLEAHNGSLGVSGVSGKLDLRTVNGSLGVSEIGGDVRAHTQNGSLNVRLSGNAWEGTGLDAETRNGSVRLSVPEQYSASLEVGTVNGPIRTDIPVTVSGRISRELNIPLGGGGKPIRVHTTNGAVNISRN